MALHDEGLSVTAAGSSDAEATEVTALPPLAMVPLAADGENLNESLYRDLSSFKTIICAYPVL